MDGNQEIFPEMKDVLPIQIGEDGIGKEKTVESGKKAE
jgi:hypothetical protein